MGVSRILRDLRRLAGDDRGNIGLMMGLLAVPVIGAVGLGIDFTRSTSYRMQTDSAAAAASIAAVDTVRALLAANPNTPESEIIAQAKDRVEKIFQARTPKNADVSVSLAETTVTRVGETVSASVSYKGQVKTTFAAILGVESVALSGSGRSNGVYDQTSRENADPDLLISERFGTNVGELQNGTWGVYANYNNWKTTGSGVEIGLSENYGAAPPTGMRYVAELDSDGNVAMSKKVYMPTGNYELRYWIKDRIPYTEYDPVWLCGSKTEDVDWARDTNGTWGYQTNRVGVYLDIALSDTPPATFSPTTNNLIDVCVNTGQKWIERSVKIVMTQPSFYWLTFQAEGLSDTTGSVLSNIRLCRNACAGTKAPDYPWTANQLLFTDGFETPAGSVSDYWTERTLDTSGVNTGWPRLPSGWTTHPVNQIDFQDWGTFLGPSAGRNVVELDASTWDSNTSNRSISRRMLLAPGYYRLKYTYISMPWWGVGGQDVCGMSFTNSTQVSTVKSLTPGAMYPADTARVGVYIDPDVNVSHPESAPTLRAYATWKNHDGTPESRPRLPANLVDRCYYSKEGIVRDLTIRILKPSFYWLTFTAGGTADNHGGGIDNVTLTAMRGLEGAAPSRFIAVPPPGLAPGTPIVMNGLQIASQ